MLFNAANKSQQPLAQALLCSQPGHRDVGNWGTSMGDAQLWDTPHPCTVGRAPVHPVQQGRGNWEVMGRAAGHRGAPHPQPRGGPSPGTPTPTPFPWLCPRAPRPTDLVPPARATPLVLAAPGGGPGTPAAPKGWGSVWGGGRGGPGAAADPNGIKDLAPASHQRTPSTHEWDWGGKCSPHSLLGFGGSFGTHCAPPVWGPPSSTPLLGP